MKKETEERFGSRSEKERYEGERRVYERQKEGKGRKRYSKRSYRNTDSHPREDIRTCPARGRIPRYSMNSLAKSQ